MRLIDADALLLYAKRRIGCAVYPTDIMNFPAIELKFVFCKDCKHRHSSEFCECRPEYGFCNDGERKDDEV